MTYFAHVVRTDFTGIRLLEQGVVAIGEEPTQCCQLQLAVRHLSPVVMIGEVLIPLDRGTHHQELVVGNSAVSIFTFGSLDEAEQHMNAAS